MRTLIAIAALLGSLNAFACDLPQAADVQTTEQSVPDPAVPPRDCAVTLTQAVRVGRLFIDAGSSVTYASDRTTIRTARLLGDSTYDGIDIPPGTAWKAENDEYHFPHTVTIGPVQLNGQVSLFYREQTCTSDGTYIASRRPEQTGTMSFEGTRVLQVEFTEPDYAVKAIQLDQPGRIRGLLVADFMLFSDDGDLYAFSSGGRQVVGGVRLGGCEAVSMTKGKVTSHVLYSPERRYINNVRCDAATPAKRTIR